MPSLARKNSVPFTFVRSLGFELRVPLRTFLASVVPAAVPSLCHSSELAELLD